MDEIRTIILGAGASRGVSYAESTPTPMLSPLDTDFYDLLQRLGPPLDDEDAAAVKEVLRLASDGNLWESMERMFYTLDLRFSMMDMLSPDQSGKKLADEFRKSFGRAVQTLLRAAHVPDHLTKRCDHHINLFEPLAQTDAVITFNYDMVAEYGLWNKLSSVIPDAKLIQFPSWLYGFEPGPAAAVSCPRLYKLHGSVNWEGTVDNKEGVKVRPLDPSDTKAGYGGDVFLMMLPFWDKKIEEPPWSTIWKSAGRQLARTTKLVVWGYSLPPTDLKSGELLRLTLQNNLRELVVIDPSRDARMRWRSKFVTTRFRPYEGIEKYLADEGLL